MKTLLFNPILFFAASNNYFSKDKNYNNPALVVRGIFGGDAYFWTPVSENIETGGLLHSPNRVFQILNENKKAPEIQGLLYLGPGSNRHSRKNRILNPARLPVPPPRHSFDFQGHKDTNKIVTKQYKFSWMLSYY